MRAFDEIIWIAEPLARADNDFFQSRSVQGCHPERSEGSDALSTEILRYAQDDTLDRLSSSSCRSWLLKIIIGPYGPLSV
jgi:hypothetical protein